VSAYRVFGLIVESSVPLPYLQPVDATQPADLRVRVAAGHPGPRLPGVARVFTCRDGGPPWGLWSGEDGFTMRQEDRVQFFISRQGDWVACRYQPTLLDEVRWYLLHLVFPFVLRLRGSLSLHACAVALPGGASVFLGESGDGKSTLAAAFAREGFPVLADEVVVLPHGPRPLCLPGLPYLRLSPASLTALFDGSVWASPGHDGKLLLQLEDLSSGASTVPQPLCSIYILARRQAQAFGRRVHITPMGPKESLKALLSRDYTAALISPPQMQETLARYAELCQGLPVYRLEYASGFEVLPLVIQAVLTQEQGAQVPGSP